MTLPKSDGPEWTGSQASPDVTVNESLRRLDAGAGVYRVVDKDLTAPPGSCADGATYIVGGPSPTGAWAGHDGDIAIAVGTNATNGWYFIEPEEGTLAWVQDETPPLHYFDVTTSPGTWQDYASGVVGSLALDDLTDVEVPASPTDGYVLTYDTDSPSGWKALPPASASLTLDGLSDVDTSGVADGYILVYEDSPTGWRAVPRRLGSPWLFEVACSDESTVLTTGTAKITFRQIGSVVVDEVRASLGVAQAGGQVIVDINASGVSILSTLITIDADAKTSVGSSPQPVISDNVIIDNEEISIDLDNIGGSPVTAKGLKVQFIGRYLA